MRRTPLDRKDRWYRAGYRIGQAVAFIVPCLLAGFALALVINYVLPAIPGGGAR